MHEGEHQKTRSRARCLDKGEQCTKESAKKHVFLARRRAPKSTILSTIFLHEGKHRKARFCARGKARYRARFLARGRAPQRTILNCAQGGAPKSTILCTREGTKKHDLEHIFFARGKAPKSTMLCTKQNTQINVRPKYKEILFLTVTAIRTDSSYFILNGGFLK